MDEPWISVRTPDNGVTEVSIREAFHRATEFRGLAGEIPTQEAAVLRLLLAIAIQATARFRSDDEKIDDWGQWWEEGLPPRRDRLLLGPVAQPLQPFRRQRPIHASHRSSH
ncbi:type I-E CRISPR-associated protein Cse1/CasA [Cutibacterium acnes]|uniref:type I-E CRISPR-associated protein Cse1/CasA n=1 Tax=Cutibacterium acnes TaxID=1747 RepID=UPI0023DC60BF|nr:type I-E CRISPR-associated protein Cse1/CasA [Cutibacterium acnes]MDF2230600.1 type I-E CRISPR-associated protein Cse1/CasA [Cutibacterium acnes subsp. defendens]